MQVEKLFSGCRWAEGPAWFAAGRYLVWSDIPNDRMLRWDETDGSVSVFRHPANNTNGHTVDREGRLVSCEHRGRCVSRTEHDGTRTVLADRFEGKRLNSPNDLVVKSDGSIWFTDPSYGIDSTTKATRHRARSARCSVYRFDPTSGASPAWRATSCSPTGWRSRPTSRWLYIVDTGATHVADGPHHVRRFQVRPTAATLAGGEVFATCPVGLFDGLRIDMHGNLWLSPATACTATRRDGALIGKIRVPETVANVCFGGAKLNRLFICATTSLYSVYLNAV